MISSIKTFPINKSQKIMINAENDKSVSNTSQDY